MKQLAENFQSLPLALKPTGGSTSIGIALGRIGSGRPLTVSPALADIRPADTELRLVAALEQCSGRLPVLQTQTYFPNSGPTYSVVSQVKWDCPREKLPEVVSIIEGAFKAAPPERIANELYKLRMLTAGRDQKDASDQEAENVIWLEQLRCFPGDIVIDVLRAWTKPGNPNGKWWPTWNDIAERLQRLCDRRQALLNHVRQLAARPEPTLAITDQPPTAEQRIASVERYERDIRPTLAAKENTLAPVKEDPIAALERLMARRDEPFTLSSQTQKKLAAEAGR